LRTSPRVLVLDKWTCNSDGDRRSSAAKHNEVQHHTATFIDQGYRFNASEWSSGLSAPRCIRRTLRIRGCHRMGGIRTSTGPERKRSIQTPSGGVAAEIPEELFERDRDGLNRWWEGALRSPAYHSEADWRVSQIQPRPISQTGEIRWRVSRLSRHERRRMSPHWVRIGGLMDPTSLRDRTAWEDHVCPQVSSEIRGLPELHQC